ncbi:MAG: ATP-binding protein [Bacteroidota bacterium]
MSKPEAINTVEKLIDDIRDEYKISEDCYGKMLMGVTEAVTNAIYHGNNGDASKKVNITYQYDVDKVSFIIADEGKGFDIYNIPDPTAPENLEKASGRGIYLMKHLSDQLIFSNNGNTVEMYFHTT